MGMTIQSEHIHFCEENDASLTIQITGTSLFNLAIKPYKSQRTSQFGGVVVLPLVVPSKYRQLARQPLLLDIIVLFSISKISQNKEFCIFFLIFKKLYLNSSFNQRIRKV